LTPNAEKPVLKFIDDVTKIEYYAQNVVTLSNPLAITDNTAALKCSFAGGCQMDVMAEGLTTMLKASKNNYISVCGQKCDLMDNQSDLSKSSCAVPAISTLYSNLEFGIAESVEDLKTSIYTGTNANSKAAFDNNNLNNAGDTSTLCTIGTSFSTGHIGLIS